MQIKLNRLTLTWDAVAGPSVNYENDVFGGIGVAGGSAERDEQCAQTSLCAFNLE